MFGPVIDQFISVEKARILAAGGRIVDDYALLKGEPTS
jgi:hypothetical protein